MRHRIAPAPSGGGREQPEMASGQALRPVFDRSRAHPSLFPPRWPRQSRQGRLRGVAGNPSPQRTEDPEPPRKAVTTACALPWARPDADARRSRQYSSSPVRSRENSDGSRSAMLPSPETKWQSLPLDPPMMTAGTPLLIRGSFARFSYTGQTGCGNTSAGNAVPIAPRDLENCPATPGR